MFQLRGRKPGFVVFFCVAFLFIFDSTVSTSTRRLLEGQSLTDCSVRGIHAAAEAAEYACYNVKARCQPSALETILDPPVTSNDMFDDLEFNCLRAAETSCQTESRQSITADVDRICLDLLLMGPPESIPGCLSDSDAIEEFNWSVRDFCSQNIEVTSPVFASAPSVEEAISPIG